MINCFKKMSLPNITITISIPSFTTLRWFCDNLLALIFIGNKVDSDLGITTEIKQINADKYPEVRGRVIDFNTAARFDRSVELVLSAEDINILYVEIYLEYLRRPIKNKILEGFKYFDIQNNEIIISEILPFLFFSSNNPLITKKAVKFEIKNGQMLEYYRIIRTFHKNIENSEYQLHLRGFSSDIIYFILGSQTIDSRKPLQSMREQIRKEANPIIKKLKLIQVRDNTLILQS